MTGRAGLNVKQALEVCQTLLEHEKMEKYLEYSCPAAKFMRELFLRHCPPMGACSALTLSRS